MKKLTAILLALVLVLSTCVMASAEEKVVITWWSGNGHSLEYDQQKVAEFNASQDEVEINFVYNAENTETVLALAIQSGQAPDIIGGASSSNTYDLRTYVENGWVIPLNPYMSDEFKAATHAEELTYQGVNALGSDIYWVPTSIRGSQRIIYNKELCDAAGVDITAIKTLDQLVDAAIKLTETGAGVTYGTIMCGASSPWERLMRAIAEKSGIIPYDYVNGKFDFTGYAPIIEAGRKLVAAGAYFPGTNNLKVDPMRANFAEGLVGFYGNAAQEVGVLTSQFVPDFEWGAVELPTVTGEVTGCVGYVVNHGYQIISTCKNPEAAMKVIEFLSSDAYLYDFYAQGLGQPITSEWNEKIAGEDLGHMADFALTSYDSIYPKVATVTPDGDFYETALWKLIWSDEDLTAALQKLTDDYNAAYDREIKMGKYERIVIADFDITNPTAGTVEYKAE